MCTCRRSAGLLLLFLTIPASITAAAPAAAVLLVFLCSFRIFSHVLMHDPLFALSFVRPLAPSSRTPDLAFDIVYYIFGSVFSYEDSRVIYFFLDWGGTPGRAVTITLFLLLVGLPLSHGVHVLMAAGRDRLRRMRPDWGWQVGSQPVNQSARRARSNPKPSIVPSITATTANTVPPPPPAKKKAPTEVLMAWPASTNGIGCPKSDSGNKHADSVGYCSVCRSLLSCVCLGLLALNFRHYCCP